MANTQETLIYIEKENHTEAEFMSRNFVNKELKNRAYLNALGAELVTKYLTSEGIKFNNVHNLHSISKVLESVDIADILLPNIHLDVRVVFNEKHIFIPKSHFELDLVPDAYVVLKLDEEFKHVELLGYFKPSQINKRNENREYYFFDRDKLSSPATLTKFVKDFTGRTSRDISEEDLLRGRELAISLADHNISVSEEKELLELLLLSDVLRESVLEFDNFETLSYSTAPVLSESLVAPEIVEENEDNTEEDAKEIIDGETKLEPVEEISLATMAMDEELDLDEAFPEPELEEEPLEETLVEEPLDDPVSDEDTEEEIAEDIEEEAISEVEEQVENVLDENLIEEHIEEVAELDFVDLEPEVEEEEKKETIETDLTEELDTTEDEDLAEEELATTEKETIDESEEDDEFVNELNEAAGITTDETSLEDDILEDGLDFVEPTEEMLIEEEEITEEVEEETLNLETEEQTLQEEIVENEESTELDIAEDLSENTIEPLTEEPLAEESLALDETLEVSENVKDDILDAVEQTTPDPTIVDENLPTLDLEKAPSLEIDPTDLGDDLLGGNLVDENNEIITTTEVQEKLEETVEEEESLEIEEPPLTPDEPFVPQNMENLSVDSILDQTIASISTNKEETTEKKEEKPVEKTQPEIEPLDVAAAATATALAGAVAKAEEEAQVAVSEDAIKLASVSGEMINDVVQSLEDDQQKSLDKIDYEKTDITAEIDAPEHMIAATEDLSLAKMEASLEAELSGEFGGPTDLENLNEVEVYEEEEFVQDSIDFGSMETISKEKLFEQGNENLDLGNLSDINIDMSAGANNLPDLNFAPNEEGVVDLPQFSSGGFTISEDGTSPMDAMIDMSLGIENKEEELMDMDLGGDENSPLSEEQLDFSSCMKPSTRKREESSSYDDKPKPTIDEATKQALLANNIVRSDDDDDDSFTSEDFGETIVLDDDEPFVIDAEEIQAIDTETPSDETDISEFFGDEILEEEETPVAEETAEESLNELSFDELETMNDDAEAIESVDNVDEIQTVSEEVTEPVTEEQQDWMNDTDYTNLEDVEVQPQESVEDFITEPTAEEKTYAVKENSTIISDKSFQAGEIHIDINAQNTQMYEDDESLASIYNPNSRVPGGALLQTPGRMSNVTASQGNAARGLLGILSTLIILALVGGIGFGIAQFFKAPKEEAPQPITDGPLPTSNDNGVSEANTLKIDPNNVVKMDNNSNALSSTKKTPAQAKTQNTTASASSTQKKGPAKSFVSIEKVTWSLPSYITHNTQFKQYFQSAGKSLKLSLTSDLLLATDYIYSDNMRVGITFGKDGSLQSSQIITSSGSNEIDKIVLQTVNQVLTALKAPNSVGNEENTPVTLNIYF